MSLVALNENKVFDYLYKEPVRVLTGLSSTEIKQFALDLGVSETEVSELVEADPVAARLQHDAFNKIVDLIQEYSLNPLARGFKDVLLYINDCCVSTQLLQTLPWSMNMRLLADDLTSEITEAEEQEIAMRECEWEDYEDHLHLIESTRIREAQYLIDTFGEANSFILDELAS